MRARRRPAGLARGWPSLVAAVVAGCGLFGRDINLPCPSAAVMAEAAETISFRPGPGRDLTDVRYEGRITRLDSTCEYDEDGFVDVDVTVGFELARGPAADNDVGRYQYFVAVADPEGNIIAKKIFPIEVEFRGAATRARLAEEVSERIFYRPRDDASGYRVLVGFQLTREQLEYLRGRARGGG